ncbi:hypothetical protein EAI75_07210 [Bifidobacterium longum]|uniref:Uncharacterized protein n=4 Tax=Bifidobacterium longum TaxID=216816 RepID=Q8G6H4_BIFLO|nr:hypothetical protein BL0667 [Bifidobacterium longum NCC2705]AXF99366.1 hypothetical protein DVB78_09805 [Bifidobacterium longum subsp. longum]KAB6720317.1 hypothetical protein GBL36_08385 [Bifidobacterium longum]MBM5830469.1 hypothetical protein [Bifidobacterium longum subsp. suillum]MSB31103.1 hypothetical protein [Ligilactobacillus ruminis]OIN62591.1 hypothetical protein BFS26_07995 [Bifidobacterium longum subsp. suis]
MHPRKSACSDPPNHMWHCSHLRLNRSSTDPQPPCNRHLEFRGAVLTLSGDLSPFRGAGTQVSASPKWRNDGGAKPFIPVF